MHFSTEQVRVRGHRALGGLQVGVRGHRALGGLQEGVRPYLFVEGVEEDGGLDRLAQAHLVGQDGVGALGPGEPQPVQPLQLVGVQRAPRGVDVPRLVLKLYGGLGGGAQENTNKGLG